MLLKGNEPRASVAQILMTLAAFVVVIAGMRAASQLLVPFLLAAFIAIISSPPLFWLQRKGLPAWLSLLIVVLVILLIGSLIGWMLGSSFKAFSGDLPAYEITLRQQMEAGVKWLASMGVDTSGIAFTEVLNPGSVMKLAASLFSGLQKMLSYGFLILMTVIFILLEASGLPAKLIAITGPQRDTNHFDRFINNVKDYMAIKTIVSLITGILATLLLLATGVNYPMLWGLLAFLLNYVPNIGSIIAALPAVLLAFIQFGIGKTLIVAVGYFVINVVMGSVIEPRFMGKTLGLSTLVVFLSLLFWGWVLGPVGMLLSVPLTITAKIALDSKEETRWLSILLGSGPSGKKPT
ncbi:MAG: AI-2E family transporter [Deltaproteobacteria bacterium]|nr:AI-2E family transporter [Deltaproteobacteria bacterium]